MSVFVDVLAWIGALTVANGLLLATHIGVDRLRAAGRHRADIDRLQTWLDQQAEQRQRRIQGLDDPRDYNNERGNPR